MQHTTPTTRAIISQASTATSTAIPEVVGVEQIGLMGIVVVLLLREGLAWFRTKETAEQALVNSLVTDLRDTQKNLLDKLFQLNAEQHQDSAELRAEIRSMCDRLDKIL